MDENMFPPTFIGEFYGQSRFPATAGNFEALEINLQDYCETTDVKNPEIESSVYLFPTLADNFINLRCGDNICGDLRIIDIEGRVIQYYQGHQHVISTNILDISALSSGTYFLQTNINEYYLTRRFIKI